MAAFLCQEGRLEEAEKTFLRAAANPLYETPEIAITNAGSLSLVTINREAEAEKYYQRGTGN